MCGIAGIFNPEGLRGIQDDPWVIKSMAMSMHNRGPDEKGVLYSDIAHLGHARLSIIDLATGQQPMYSSVHDLAVVFNGEIFNYKELREELIGIGRRFMTESDTETLIHLYQEHGEGMLEKLNGQFAFAIVDFKNAVLFMARDRIGIRPLYYTVVDNTLVFASTLKAILKCPGVEARFNFKAYNQMIHLWTTFGRESFLEGVYSLRPGEALTFSREGIRKKIYWDLAFGNVEHGRELEYWKSEVREALDKATKLRLRADVPVNAYLSGGLDSSIILSLIQRHHAGDMESFSVAFTSEDFDESPFQKLLSDHTAIENNAVTISPEQIGEIFDRVIYHAEQPIFRTAPVPLYYLSRLVNGRGLKVVLTGEGADEVAWGYSIFKETLIRRHLSQDPDNPEWLGMIPRLNPHLKQFKPKYRVLLADFYKKSLSDPDSALFSHEIKMASAKNMLNFVLPDVKERLLKHDVKSDIESMLPEEFSSWSPLQKTQYLEMKTLLAGYLLSSQGDRMAMAHSVEARFPFLDHNVVELFSRMPDRFKLNGMNEKYILKETFKPMLPKQIIDRPKFPYRSPEGVSLLSEKIRDTWLNEREISRQNFFKWQVVKRLMDKLTRTNGSGGFNDNFVYTNIVGTTMFQTFLENRFQDRESTAQTRFLERHVPGPAN